MATRQAAARWDAASLVRSVRNAARKGDCKTAQSLLRWLRDSPGVGTIVRKKTVDRLGTMVARCEMARYKR